MEISGLSYFNAYFQYTSNNTNVNNAATFQKVTAVSGKTEADVAKTTNASAIDIYQASRASAGATSFADVLSMQYKSDAAESYQEELADAKINDPEKYQSMILESKEAAAKSFSQVVDLADSNGGIAVYNGVTIAVDSENQQMNVGDMSDSENVISVELSNGWAFNFNRDNIDDISKMLDMFSPEDIRRIMEAITKDNIAVSMEKEIDDEKASVASKTADTAVQTGQISVNSLTEDKADADVLTDTEQKSNNAQVAESTSSGTSSGAGSGNEDSEVTAEIVTNPDGSRKLVITTKIGDTETVTNIKLAPESEANKLQQKTSFQRPTEFQSMHAMNAYEANFMYAS